MSQGGTYIQFGNNQNNMNQANSATNQLGQQGQVFANNNLNNMNNAFRANKSKKTVTFKDNVDIINVECYKEYNKMDDDEINLNDVYLEKLDQEEERAVAKSTQANQLKTNTTPTTQANKNIQNNKQNNNQKKGCGCDCNIF